MNLYGFLATMLICTAVVIVVWLLTKEPIRVHITKQDNIEPPQMVTVDTTKYTDTKSTEELEKLLNEQPVISMDNVIKSANELMGIEVVNKEEQVNETK